MRIHPATGFILERRVPAGGLTLHGVYLPENTIVGVNAWALHYNKDVFGHDVHAFRPERWARFARVPSPAKRSSRNG